MQTSIFIAKLIGPILVVAGLTTLLNPKHLEGIAREFIASPALIFIAGFITLLGGLVIINTHNVWTANWPVLITIFGWIAIAAGILRMSFPSLVKSLGEAMLAKRGLLGVAAAVQVALGGFFVFKGYL